LCPLTCSELQLTFEYINLNYFQIFFDNADHDGQMLLSLDADAVRLYCKGDVEYIGESNLFLLCIYVFIVARDLGVVKAVTCLTHRDIVM
jgi:hypothetical protein